MANDEYALVLNRKSGDMAILSVPAITKNQNRYKTAGITREPANGSPNPTGPRMVFGQI